jgi:predicted transcriptional regulator
METLTISQYALAHKLPVEQLTQVAESQGLDSDPGSALPVPALDEIAALLDEVAADDLRDAWTALADAREYARRSIAVAESELQCSVIEALREGMPATRIAEVLGISRARVYQIRDGKR